MGGMGIAYKDLKSGRYYKGTLDDGSKVFMFVESLSQHNAGNNIGVTSCEFVRRTSGGQWAQRNIMTPAGGDSKMRREVTLAEVQAEGVYRCPSDKGPTTSKSPTPTGSTTLSGTKAGSTKPPSPALRKDGTPKAVIEENKTATTCLHCKRPTKTMTLFQFSNQWCPDCEP